MEAVNSAEGIIHDTEAKMEEFKDQLPADEVLISDAIQAGSFSGNYLKERSGFFDILVLALCLK